MFDAIGVSEAARKPWTLAVSFAGQAALMGLAVLIPLLTTESLPRERVLSYFVSPGPPPAPRPRPPAPKPTKTAPANISEAVLRAPSVIPARVAVIQDPVPAALPTMDGPGVPGGIGDPTGSGNGVIESVVRNAPAPPPLAPVVKKAAAPAAIPRIRMGGALEQAKLIFAPPPTYPTLARNARVSGAVHLQAVIARDGRIMNLEVIDGPAMLIEAAMTAVKQWVFRPTYLNGEPVEVATDITVNFTLGH